MKSYNLNIAGYNIMLEAEADGPELTPSERFLRNVVQDTDSDILIKVHACSFNLPEGAERVFHAPLYEEINGIPKKTGDNFWSIYRNRADLFIKTIFPYDSKDKKGILRFSLTSREWDLFLDLRSDSTDPLDYPLDSLILYYLTVIKGDIFVHASGINNAGHGYIFSGVSGKGKTTMTKLWNNAGAKVIHDDRLVIRNTGGEFRMFNTPVYRDDAPSESALTKIFLIEHGTGNRLTPVTGATAVSLFLANCIQHNWNPEIIARLMGSISIMCSVIPVYKLSFRPDRSIIDFILDYE